MFQFDAVPLLNKQTYGHGSFMGSAPEFANNSKWMKVLELLMPDVYRSILNSDEVKLIKQMENNPVMAAFGIYETNKANLINPIKTNITTLEIDMYLPTQRMQQFISANSIIAKKGLAKFLVQELLVAHGTALQIAAQNLGVNQYESIIQNDIANLGGVLLPVYFSLFSKALQLINIYDRIQNPSQQNINIILIQPTIVALAQATQLFKLYTTKELSILLDIKSAAVTPEMITYMIPEINKLGIIVSHIASFKFTQITGVNQQQTVLGLPYPAPIPVKFFHMSGNVQKACLDKTLLSRDTISFNIGSLIEYDSLASQQQRKTSYKVNWYTLAQLRGFKTYYNLNIFGYVQEFDIDESAVKLLIELVNTRSDIFNLGFAWGNVNNKKTASSIEPSLTGVTIGLSTQILAGTLWNNSLPFYSTSGLRGGSSQIVNIASTVGKFDLNPVRVEKNLLGVSFMLRSACNSTCKVTIINKDANKSIHSDTIKLSAAAGTYTIMWNNIKNGNYFVRIDNANRCAITGSVDLQTIPEPNVNM